MAALKESMTLDELETWLAVNLGQFQIEFSAMNFEIFAYLGSNPADLLKALVARERDNTRFIQDMSTLIALSQIRGTAITKILAKTASAGKTKIQSLITKYGIVAHSKMVPMTTPTLPRIVGLFPKIVYNFRLSFPKIVRTVGTVPSGMSEALAFPNGAAMIKSTNVELIELWYLWYQSFCSIVKMTVSRENALISQQFSRVDESDRI